ncbi:MAG: hypothetical protein HOO06_14585 [Bdellovibrionaceae bacterium]|jgi:hypothetical protein|nr:hypothetical protein [Pseudobdellovibrionaceae bacterium]
MSKNKWAWINCFIILLLFTSEAYSKARYVFCPQKYPAVIRVPFANVMVMEFPEKPKHSLAGRNSFDFQYIGNDIGIKALTAGGHANLFIYLGKKRCAFKLVTTKSRADDIVVIKYSKEKNIEVNYVQ